MKEFINKIVARKYRIIEKLGRGATSSVYKAKEITTGHLFALKKYITSDPADKEKLIESIQNELRILKNVAHPVLPKIYDVIWEDDSFYLIMEYVEGINLERYIRKNGVLSKKKLLSIMEQVCSGLYYLHSLDKPIIYRDLKPSNIILQKDGRIKLIDFGISKRYNKELDADLYAIGSKGFAAPEQYGDSKGAGLYNTDIRSDIYGIGSTMYYLRTGKCYKKDFFSLRVYGRLKKIIVKCTYVDPNLRYQNCIQVLCDLNKL